MSWPMVPLGDLCSVASGGTPTRTNPNYYGGEIPWVKIGDMVQGIVSKTEESITRDALENSSAKVFQKGTLLLSIFATVGRTAILGIDAATNQAIAGITPNNAVLDINYLRHFLDSSVQDLLKRSRGVAQVNINLSILKSILVPLPPMEEQRRIAGILDKAEELRAKRRATLALLNHLPQAIFLEMFGDPVTNPRALPQMPIRDIGRVITGNTPSRACLENFGSAIEWIKSDNLNTTDYFVSKAEEGLSERGRSVGRCAPADSILVTCIAGSPQCIGNAGMADREVAFNQQINALIPAMGNPHFLYAQMVVGKKLIQNASTASMKGMVSKGRFEQILLLFPAVTLQHEFGRFAEVALKQKQALVNSQTRIDSLCTALQRRAFGGPHMSEVGK